jgi:hypothetical protein
MALMADAGCDEAGARGVDLGGGAIFSSRISSAAASGSCAGAGVIEGAFSAGGGACATSVSGAIPCLRALISMGVPCVSSAQMYATSRPMSLRKRT